MAEGHTSTQAEVHAWIGRAPESSLRSVLLHLARAEPSMNQQIQQAIDQLQAIDESPTSIQAYAGDSKKRPATPNTPSTPRVTKKINVTAEDVQVLQDSQSQEDFKDRYQHCSRCYELFDTKQGPSHKLPVLSAGVNEAEGNSKCTYHGGVLEIVDDAEQWEKYDGEGCGRRDSDSARIDFPDMYRWTCCGLEGSGNPCKTGRHISDDSQSLCHYARIQRLVTD